MNIHEYQAKAILKQHGVPIQEGILAHSPKEALEAARQLQEQTGTGWWVLKAQIHAGGRGKGGGVKLARSIEDVEKLSSEMIGMQLVTHQTGKEGKKVRKILVAQDVYYPGPVQKEEYYMSVLLNRKTGRDTIMYSPEGGMDIEEVSDKTPELIFKEEIDPGVGLLPFQARKIAFNLGLAGNAFKEMIGFVTSLYRAYRGVDASLFEINPVLKTTDEKILAVDAKVNLDDNALFRHPDLAEMRDVEEEDAAEVEAGKYNLNFVKLDGNVGCMVNGAGLAMATMDIIKLSGGEPANFLDVGGGANAETVEAGLKIILNDPSVKAVLINIFGGIVRCDRVASGVVEAYKKLGNINVPVIVRLQGTNAEQGKQVIDDSGLKVRSAITLQEAAAIVKEVV
ncbi:MAG: succinate--CoA ligase subunit beta [Anaerophaga sp.]|uniref:ADP-forming succinate--CoA ligase subunit beta n=1 Tax=Anaerophaga thermohalophila TaxID=177400 RepID=UPI000237D5DF|nr:ADP-forming succinate--CoA ligase subunit beta [Anaerophaga thermohalophila]MBZ4677284.1 succinate--CoA ligase subunit beta [Anaerophaga sp.]MDI3521190.1 succinyl-CoA synthetase beta subunit [Anaerophaga sp.]MDN5291229.1 succinyl-CoA synthetase beta subunit [Anaerophaga sp.]